MISMELKQRNVLVGNVENINENIDKDIKENLTKRSMTQHKKV